MAATLRTVANEAAVSVSTASRALQSSPRISAETQERVKLAAAKLGYRPNPTARALRTRRSRLIGLVLNNLINVSFHTIAEAVQRSLSAEGYQLILSMTDGDPHAERDLLLALADHGVDGVIVIGSGQNGSVTNGFLGSGIAVVNAIRSSADSAAPTVLAGDRDGAFAATEHLLSLGHRRIGYIGGLESADSGRERFRGYRDALEGRGYSIDSRLVRQGPFTPAFGMDAINDLLVNASDMTALFAANHEAVFGILPALVATNTVIPDDLSIICYEDMPLLQMWQPAISVVDNGAGEIANMAVNLLLKQIAALSTGIPSAEQLRKLTRTYRVGAQLIHRASSTSPPAGPNSH